MRSVIKFWEIDFLNFLIIFLVTTYFRIFFGIGKFKSWQKRKSNQAPDKKGNKERINIKNKGKLKGYKFSKQDDGNK